MSGEGALALDTTGCQVYVIAAVPKETIAGILSGGLVGSHEVGG